MIAKLAPKRRVGRGSFSTLKRYFEFDERELTRDDLVASWSGLVASHETAALAMEAVAYGYAQRGHEGSWTVPDPVYHVILSTRPGESFEVEQAKLAVDATRHSLDADRPQYFAEMHHDVDTDRYHVRLAIKQISLDGRVLDRSQDYAKLGRAAEWFERETGLQVDRHVDWRETLGERELGLVPEPEKSLERAESVARSVDRQEGATIDLRDALRSAHYFVGRTVAAPSGARGDDRGEPPGPELGRSSRGAAQLQRLASVRQAVKLIGRRSLQECRCYRPATSRSPPRRYARRRTLHRLPEGAATASA